MTRLAGHTVPLPGSVGVSSADSTWTTAGSGWATVIGPSAQRLQTPKIVWVAAA